MIINFFNTRKNELETLKARRYFLYETYIELDKRTTASKELKRQIEDIDFQILELEEEMYG